MTSRYLVVTIANPAPFIFMQEPVEHRTVVIELTEQQVAKLALQKLGYNCGKEIHEYVSTCHLQETRP